MRFHAINAGYKDDASAQNYDFIELERLTDSGLGLAPFRIVYTNSSGNLAGEISFAEDLLLSSEHLLLGASVSPQYSQLEGSIYSYNFGSSGLASTAGKLELYQDDQLIDEICWGKLTCSSSYAKFATKEEDNYSLVRCSGDCADNYVSQKYYPSPNPDSITTIVTETEEPDPSCSGIVIGEIYSYYTTDISEQFVELYNPTETSIPLDFCTLRYKKTTFPLSGNLDSGEYYLFRSADLALTKDPASSNLLEIIDSADSVVASASYPHGQKKGTSYALFDANLDTSFWRQTYSPTPGSANIYQEFQSCPAGKIINPTTGNCVKKATRSTITCPAGKYLNPLTNRCKNITAASTLTPCKEGYERNPVTNRCRKITSATTALTPCKDGYERNPETNRCRKIRENTGETTDYAPTPTSEEDKYQNPKIFIAITAFATVIVAGFVYVVYQYRQEIRKAFRRLTSRFRKV